MKFSAALLSVVGLAAVAHAASGTTSAPAPTTTSAETKCLDACAKGDVNCQASCVGDPSPNSSMISDTTSCVAACPKGKGTDADNAAYAKCLNSCISSSFLPSGTAAAAAQTTDSSAATTTDSSDTSSTASSGSAPASTGGSSTGSSGSSKTGSSASSTGSSDSSASATSGGSSSSGTSTGSAAASSSSGSSAASNVQVGGFITGAFAFFAAVLAL